MFHICSLDPAFADSFLQATIDATTTEATPMVNMPCFVTRDAVILSTVGRTRERDMCVCVCVCVHLVSTLARHGRISDCCAQLTSVALLLGPDLCRLAT